MARIAGVDIPREKRVEISLTYIYGIGLTTSKKILERAWYASPPQSTGSWSAYAYQCAYTPWTKENCSWQEESHR